MSANRSDNADLFQDVVWGQNHDLFEDRLGRSLLRAYELGACDGEIANMIRNRVEKHKTSQALGQALPFRVPRLPPSGVVLGAGEQGQRIAIPKQWLNAGALVLGNTGAGKTTLLILLLQQIAALGCRFWVTDLYKRQLRHLRPLLDRMGQELIVLQPDRWKYNLLQAGNRDPRLHLAMAVDLLARVLDLPGRATSILRQVCHFLYAQFGVFDGAVRGYPTLFDVYERIRAGKDLNAPAREAILDRLGSLLTSLTPRCAAYRRAWDPMDLARYCIVFEMHGAAEHVKAILLESCLFALLHSEVQRGTVNAPMDLWVCFEDGQRFFCGRRDAAGEIPPMDELAGVVRGSAKGLCVLAQSTHGLSRSVTANMATKIMGRLGQHEDYQQLGADMGLSGEQIQWAKLNLQPGLFIGQVSEGPWRLPFVFRVPAAHIAPCVDDNQVDASLAALDALPVVAATEFEHWTIVPRVELATPQPATEGEPKAVAEPALSTASAGSAQATPSTATLSDVELRFLRAIFEAPGLASSEYPKRLGISPRRAQQIRQRLIHRGYLRERKIAARRRGRECIVLEPLAPANAAIAVGDAGNAQPPEASS